MQRKLLIAIVISMNKKKIEDKHIFNVQYLWRPRIVVSTYIEIECVKIIIMYI